MKKFIVSQKKIRAEQHQVNGYQLGYDISTYRDTLFADANIEMPAHIQRSVIKRKAEFLAGRIAARLCLEDLHIKDFQIASNQDRSPVWPDEITGSISHSNQTACCLVAQKHSIRGIGIDLESIIATDLLDSILNTVVNQAELAILKQLSDDIYQQVSLIFSAKESLFKALYPEVQKFFDFSAAELISIDLNTQHFCLELKEDLSIAWKIGMQISGYFEFFEQYVFTRIIIPK